MKFRLEVEVKDKVLDSCCINNNGCDIRRGFYCRYWKIKDVIL